MTAQVFGAADRVAKAGDTMSGTLTITANPPMTVTSAAGSGKTLVSDGAGHMTLQAPPNAIDWKNVQTFGATGNGTSDDTAAINAALSAATAGQLVYLPAGTYKTTAPLQVPPGVMLAGVKGGINFGSANTPTGSVIKPAATFASTLAVTSVIAMLEPSGSVACTGCQVANLAIDGSSAPGGVDGIASYGAVNGLAIYGVSIAKVTRRGIAWYTSGASNDGDGFWGERIIVQSAGFGGIYRPPSDASLVNVHVQGCGNGTGIDGAGIYVINGGNTRFDTVRADLSSGSGFYLDHSGAGGGYTDAISLVNCGTQRNAHHGVHVTNSSATGASWRDPVIIAGCNFDEDGHNNGAGGEYAGIFVEGQNNVLISGTSVWQGTVDYASGCPKYGLLTGTIGSGSTKPERISWAGGHLNYSSVAGGLPVKDNAAVQGSLRISSDVTGNPGYQQTGNGQNRQGTATLPGGGTSTSAGVTVTNDWATTSTRIVLSIITPSATIGNQGIPYVKSRSAGSFVIASTGSNDTASIAWQIVSQ